MKPPQINTATTNNETTSTQLPQTMKQPQLNTANTNHKSTATEHSYHQQCNNLNSKQLPPTM
jgi:hypothetical protein